MSLSVVLGFLSRPAWISVTFVTRRTRPRTIKTMSNPPLNRLCLLGMFQLVYHGKQVTLGQPRLQELVALLAVRPGIPCPRTQIAYHFWPESSEQQARTNARNLLYKLKQAWPGMDKVVTLGRTHVTWHQDADLVADVHRFEEQCADAEQGQSAIERAHALSKAMECYGGDFLPGTYADWALTVREQLRSRYASVLDALIDARLVLREYAEALQQARQLRDHDPLQESAYRRLMQIHVLQGDRVAALRVYHQCASILQKELGVELSPATQELHDQSLRHFSACRDRFYSIWTICNGASRRRSTCCSICCTVPANIRCL